MIIDFRKIEVTDLEGNKSTFDVRKELGNTIYNSTTDLGEWFFVKFGGNLFFISTVFFFLNPIKSCRYVCFLVTLKTPHH